MPIYSVKHLHLTPAGPYFPSLSPCCSACETCTARVSWNPGRNLSCPFSALIPVQGMHRLQVRLHSCPTHLEVAADPTAFPLDHASPYGPTSGHIRCMRVTGKDIQGLPQAEAMLQAKHMEMLWLFFSFFLKKLKSKTPTHLQPYHILQLAAEVPHSKQKVKQTNPEQHLRLARCKKSFQPVTFLLPQL